jgi:hypothetical protein
VPLANPLAPSGNRIVAFLLTGQPETGIVGMRTDRVRSSANEGAGLAAKVATAPGPGSEGDAGPFTPGACVVHPASSAVATNATTTDLTLRLHR